MWPQRHLPAPISQTETTYPVTTQDVLSAVHSLRHACSTHLPTELIKLIFFHADYDRIRVATTGEGLARREGHLYDTQPPEPYIESQPLQHLSGPTPGRIVSVSLKATGHDQGFVNNRDLGVWSWFEVGKRRDGEKEVQRGPAWAFNAMADARWQDHEFVFLPAEEPVEGQEELAAWVRDLRDGDRVSILPMSRFPAWACNVKKARIDVMVEVWH